MNSWLKLRRNQEIGELMVETTERKDENGELMIETTEKSTKRWTQGLNHGEIKKTVNPLLKRGRNQDNGELMVETKEKARQR